MLPRATNLRRHLVFYVLSMLCLGTPALANPPGRFEFAQMRLLVCDFPAVRRFYEEVLRLPVAFVGDQYVEFKTAEHASIGVFAKSEMPGIKNDCPRASTVLNNDTVVVVQVVNLDRMARHLTDQRVPMVLPPQNREGWGVRTAHFLDPAGNLVELLEALPKR